MEIRNLSNYSKFKVGDKVKVKYDFNTTGIDDYYYGIITKLLDENASSRTIFPSLKEQIGKKDVALKDMELNDVRILYSMLIS